MPDDRAQEASSLRPRRKHRLTGANSPQDSPEGRGEPPGTVARRLSPGRETDEAAYRPLRPRADRAGSRMVPGASGLRAVPGHPARDVAPVRRRGGDSRVHVGRVAQVNRRAPWRVPHPKRPGPAVRPAGPGSPRTVPRGRPATASRRPVCDLNDAGGVPVRRRGIAGAYRGAGCRATRHNHLTVATNSSRVLTWLDGSARHCRARAAPDAAAIRHAQLDLSWVVLQVLENRTTPGYHDVAGTPGETKRFTVRVRGPLPGTPAVDGEFSMVIRRYGDNGGWWIAPRSALAD